MQTLVAALPAGLQVLETNADAAGSILEPLCPQEESPEEEVCHA